MAFLNEHTAGDWINTTDGEANFYGIANGNDWLLRIQQNGKLTVQEQEANAKLIAAAPKMRQLVEMFHDSLEAGFIKNMCIEVLTQAGVEITSLKELKCKCDGEEILHQGNGFVYKTCADCGKDI